MSQESSEPEEKPSEAPAGALKSLKGLLQKTAEEIRQAPFEFQDSFGSLEQESEADYPALVEKKKVLEKVDEGVAEAHAIDQRLETAGPAVRLVVKPILIQSGENKPFPSGQNLNVKLAGLKEVRLARSGVRKGDQLLRDIENKFRLSTAESIDIGDYAREEIANAKISLDIPGYEYVDSNQTSSPTSVKDKKISLAGATSAVHTIQPRFKEKSGSGESEGVIVEVKWKRRPEGVGEKEWNKYIDSKEKLYGSISIQDVEGNDIPLKNKWKKPIKSYTSEKITQAKLKGAKVKIGIAEERIWGASNDGSTVGFEEMVKDIELTINPAKRGGGFFSGTPKYTITLYLDSNSESDEAENVLIEVEWKRRPEGAKRSEWNKYVNSNEQLYGNITLQSAAGDDIPLKNKWKKPLKSYVSEKIPQSRLKGAKVTVGIAEERIWGASNDGSTIGYERKKKDVEFIIKSSKKSNLLTTPRYKITLYLDSAVQDPHLCAVQIVTHAYSGSGPDNVQKSYKPANLEYKYTLTDSDGKPVVLSGVEQREIAKATPYDITNIPAGNYTLVVETGSAISFAVREKRDLKVFKTQKHHAGEGNRVTIPIELVGGETVKTDVYVKKGGTTPPPPPAGSFKINWWDASDESKRIDSGRFTYDITDSAGRPLESSTISFGAEGNVINKPGGASNITLIVVTDYHIEASQILGSSDKIEYPEGTSQINIALDSNEVNVYLKKISPPPTNSLYLIFEEHVGGDPKDIVRYIGNNSVKGKLSYTLHDAGGTELHKGEIDFTGNTSVSLTSETHTVNIFLESHVINGKSLHDVNGKSEGINFFDEPTRILSVDVTKYKAVALYIGKERKEEGVTLVIWTLDGLGIPAKEPFKLKLEDQEVQDLAGPKYEAVLPKHVNLEIVTERDVVAVILNNEPYGKAPWMKEPVKEWTPSKHISYGVNDDVKDKKTVLYLILKDDGGPETGEWPPPQPPKGPQKALPPGPTPAGLLTEGSPIDLITDGSEDTEESALELVKKAEEIGEDEEAGNKWVDKKLWDTFETYLGNLRKYEEKLLKFVPHESHKDVIEGAKRFFDKRIAILEKFVERKEKELFGEALEALAECQDVIAFVAKAAKDSIELRLKINKGVKDLKGQKKQSYQKKRNILQKADKQLSHMLNIHHELIERIRKSYPNESAHLATFEKSIKTELGVPFERIASIFAEERPHQVRDVKQIMNELSIRSRHLGMKLSELGKLMPEDYDLDVVKSVNDISPIKILAAAVSSASMDTNADIDDVVTVAIQTEMKTYTENVPDNKVKKAIEENLLNFGLMVVDSFKQAEQGNPDHMYSMIDHALAILDNFEKGLRASGVVK